MHSRFFLRWTFIASTFVSITLFLAALSYQTIAHTTFTKPRLATQGSLMALDSSGNLTGLCPLKQTTVKAEISGFLSRVFVTQEFENPFEQKIEAVYIFPLPQNAAVDDMTMLVGDRTIKAKIMRRQEAKAVYEAARSGGQVASLLEQERPNIFTQSVANILPGEKVRVTLSYVEVLTYEDGAYQFVFPMVVGPRYTPGAASEQSQVNSPTEAEAERVPDAARISPPLMQNGTRAGHDISIEVALDAGVPIESLNSASHEIEMERADASRAIVRLKDQATIPNKDFVFKYDVAGRKVEDAVLAHRSAKGGFFTLILQPPDRVTVEDVTPKEIVFVLDTSGSMSGFPLDRARETAKLALDNLYPQDTFNLISFSGDTHVLFPEPVPATPENLSKAKKFLDGSRSGGGTEMMKAIRAALDPSDAQGHIRIACFMTDGQVGNDLEIIAEVQKHANARVFAMGFGTAPNRFLLDKMAEYGRGEVEYVIGNEEDNKEVARRFHERVRSPLLTDLSIDWAGLPVADVYPHRIPDLFSAKPVVLSGRFTAGGRAVIRLKGKMSGRDFMREIPVELPDSNPAHEVLATLWARQRISDLMGQDMNGVQTGKMRDDLREAITGLGLEYRLLTQFTSFVAIEEKVVTDNGEPRRVDVAVEAPVWMNSPGSVTEYMTSQSMVGATVNVSSISTVTSGEYQAVTNLSLNGRSFKSLVLLPPGTVLTGTNPPGNSMQNQISVNGQRPTSNSFFIDGVSANIGIAPGLNPGLSTAGTTPGLTASGGTNNLVSAEAIEEVTVKTSDFSAEYGRTTGGQFLIATRTGTNRFRGSLFEYFGNDALDAGDWFANSRGLKSPQRRLNNFGGSLGGPIRRDQTFFFASYEGQRLRQPLVALTDVPSMAARRLAPVGLQPFLNAFPVPNGLARADGFSEFTGSYANPARHDAASLRIDQMLSNQLTLSGRYNHADSEAEERGANGFSLNTLGKIRSRTQTLTASALYSISPSAVLDLRGNYSRFSAGNSYRLDDFGGAFVPPDAVLFPPSFTRQDGLSSFDLNGRNAALAAGGDVRNAQRQFNLLGAVAMIAGNHTLKFGADYRLLSPLVGFLPFEQSILFNRVEGALAGTASRHNLLTRTVPQRPAFHNFSLYGQDEWKITSRLKLTYGVRWEINPPPSANAGGPIAVTGTSDPARLSLAPRGAPLWKTTYGNLAPRLGVAYELSQASGRQTLVHASFGVLYDTGNDEAGFAFGDSAPFIAGRSFFDLPFPPASTLAAPAASNFDSPVSVPFVAFDPHLKLPYALQWSLGVKQEIGSRQSISAAYVGTAGRRLLLAQTLLEPDADFSFVRLITNGAKSDYHSLQLQFMRRLTRGLQSLVSYTWGRSIDNGSQDSLARALLRSVDARQERGSSDFDIRHLLNASVTYVLPTPNFNRLSRAMLRNWTIDAFVNARSARPLNVVYGVPTTYGFAYLRPDLLAGVPLYLHDPAAGGGRRLNPAAFAIRAVERQGTLGRNSLRGFPLYQVDLALRRQFNFTEDVNLQFKIGAFNVFNHPNFADPTGIDTSLGSRLSAGESFVPNQGFGESASMLGRSLWGGGFSSFYHAGGTRTIQFSLKLQF